MVNTANGKSTDNVAAGDQGSKPPYIPYLTFRNFVEWIADQGVPLRFDRSFWSKKYSGSMGPQLLSALRFLGLLEGENPRPALDTIVEAKGEERKEALRQVFRAAYGNVRWEELPRATPGILSEWLGTYGPTGDTLRKAQSFFINAAKDLDISVSPSLKRMARNRQAGAKKPTGKEKPPVLNPPSSKHTPPGGGGNEESQGNTEKVKLNAGTISVSLDINLIALSEEERTVVFAFIDSFQKLKGLATK